MNELALISGEFLTNNNVVPKNKRYLFKYFKTDEQKQFLRYYFVFNSMHRYQYNTGRSCSRRWLEKLRRKFLGLEELRKKARSELDFELLGLLESGKYRKVKKFYA